MINETKPIIYVNPNNRPKRVLCEKGKIDIDYWYHWPRRVFFGLEIKKEDYEPIRQEGILSVSTTGALTRIAWRHRHWTNLFLIDNRIEVVFMGPGYTPQVRTRNLFDTIVFDIYLKTHNLMREENYTVQNVSPPLSYKVAGRKRHFGRVIDYTGWPPLK